MNMNITKVIKTIIKVKEILKYRMKRKLSQFFLESDLESIL